MKIILEEDENPDSPPAEYVFIFFLTKINYFYFSKTGVTTQPVGNLPKLNKIVESGKFHQ